MIRLTDVVKEYPNGTHALNGLTMEIQDGEFVFMVGPSGSGEEYGYKGPYRRGGAYPGKGDGQRLFSSEHPGEADSLSSPDSRCHFPGFPPD